jgi:iron complex outermembrane recepter protein
MLEPMSHLFRRSLLLSAAILTTTCAGGLSARAADQSKPPPAARRAADEVSAERIDVVGHRSVVATRATTATKTDTPIIETTQSVAVVTRAAMDERQVQTVNQALRYTPGVAPDSYGNDSRFDWLRIRGFDATTYGLYLDGMRFTPGSTGPVAEPYGLERIEVLLGPSSMLYGQAAPGGLVNLVSKKPQSTPSTEIQFMAGSYDRYQGQFDTTGPIPGTDGRVDGRLVGLVRDSDTQVNMVKDNRIYVAPSFTWHIGPRTDLTFLSWYQKDHTSGEQFFPSLGTVFANPNGRLPTDLFLGSPDQDKWDRQQYEVGFLLDHQLTDEWSLHQSFRYAHLDLNWAQVYGLGIAADDIHLYRLAFHEVAGADLFTSDSRLTGHFRTGPAAHTLLAGFDYSHSLIGYDYGYAPATPLNLYHPVYTAQAAVSFALHNDTDQYQDGLYLQDQIKLARHVLINLGGRYDWAGTQSVTRYTAGGVANAGQFDRVFTYRGGLGYLFDFGLMTYASYARSFQPSSGTNLAGSPLKPTYGKQVEVGAKYQPKGMASFLTASLFDLRQTNVAGPDPSNPLNTIQTGEIRVRGAELGATAHLFDGLDLIGAYTYLDPTITKSTTGTQGKRPQLISRNTLSLWADYQIQPRLLPTLAGLGVGLGLRYIGNTEADDADSFTVPSATLWDGAIHYDLGHRQRWRLAVNINNLFDRVYVASCSGYTTCYWGQRRQVLGSVRVRF